MLDIRLEEPVDIEFCITATNVYQRRGFTKCKLLAYFGTKAWYIPRTSKRKQELLRPLSKVEAVIENEQDLKEQGDTLNVSVKNPPKVVFTDQVSAPCRNWDETREYRQHASRLIAWTPGFA